VERLSIFYAVLFSQLPVVVQDERFDVIAVGGGLVAAQHRQALVFAGKVGLQP
jgi:hypothetical protein